MGPKIPALKECIKPLLKLLKWQGDERTLFESLPHFTKLENVEQFEVVFKNLGFDHSRITLRGQKPDDRLFPCLFIPEDQSAPKILIEISDAGILAYDSQLDKNITIVDANIAGVLVSFQRETEESRKHKIRHWFKIILFSQKRLLLFVFFLTLLQTLFMVTPSLYVVGIYDYVITSNSYLMLFSFFVGMIIIFIAMTGIMISRARFMGYVGIRIQK